MIEAKVPKDIDRYETKTVGPFTTRQAIASLVAGVIDFAVITMILRPIHMDPSNWVYILALLDLPILAVGFYKVHGVPLEKYIVDYITYSVIAPARRNEKTIIYQGAKARKPDKKNKKKKKTQSSFKAYQ